MKPLSRLGYGDSEGAIRNNENSFVKMESIRDAISYLGTLPFVDSETEPWASGRLSTKLRSAQWSRLLMENEPPPVLSPVHNTCEFAKKLA